MTERSTVPQLETLLTFLSSNPDLQAPERASLLQAFARSLIEQIRTEQARGLIIEAQLGAWEAQCAAQVTTAQAYLDVLGQTMHSDGALAARAGLERAIGSNAGHLLLRRLQRAEALAQAVAQLRTQIQPAAVDAAAQAVDVALAQYRASVVPVHKEDQ